MEESFFLHGEVLKINSLLPKSALGWTSLYACLDKTPSLERTWQKLNKTELSKGRSQVETFFARRHQQRLVLYCRLGKKSSSNFPTLLPNIRTYESSILFIHDSSLYLINSMWSLLLLIIFYYTYKSPSLPHQFCKARAAIGRRL